MILRNGVFAAMIVLSTIGCKTRESRNSLQSEELPSTTARSTKGLSDEALQLALNWKKTGTGRRDGVRALFDPNRSETYDELRNALLDSYTYKLQESNDFDGFMKERDKRLANFYKNGENEFSDINIRINDWKPYVDEIVKMAETRSFSGDRMDAKLMMQNHHDLAWAIQMLKVAHYKVEHQALFAIVFDRAANWSKYGPAFQGRQAKDFIRGFFDANLVDTRDKARAIFDELSIANVSTTTEVDRLFESLISDFKKEGENEFSAVNVREAEWEPFLRDCFRLAKERAKDDAQKLKDGLKSVGMGLGDLSFWLNHAQVRS
jgi:hypothetical protein